MKVCASTGVNRVYKKKNHGRGGGFPGNQKTPLDTPLLYPVRWTAQSALHFCSPSLGATNLQLLHSGMLPFQVCKGVTMLVLQTPVCICLGQRSFSQISIGSILSTILQFSVGSPSGPRALLFCIFFICFATSTKDNCSRIHYLSHSRHLSIYLMDYV